MNNLNNISDMNNESSTMISTNNSNMIRANGGAAPRSRQTRLVRLVRLGAVVIAAAMIAAGCSSGSGNNSSSNGNSINSSGKPEQKANQSQTASGNQNQSPSGIDKSNEAAQAQASGYPKVIRVNGAEVSIPSKPERIGALSLDAADTVLELVGTERIAVVPKSLSNPALAYHNADAAAVENKIAGATSLDPEQVLAYNADLLFMTKIHDKEKEANELLQQSGIPIITLEAWNTVDAIMNNILTIGRAVDEEKKAQEIVAEMKAKVEQITKAVEGADQPSVLVLSPLGPGTGPYIVSSSNISYDLVRLAGAKNVADELGLTRTTKATIEQIIKADPEYILLVEWEDKAADNLDEITAAPGWATLQAVKNDRVKRMLTKKVFNPNRYNAEHLEEIAKWLHPDRFAQQ